MNSFKIIKFFAILFSTLKYSLLHNKKLSSLSQLNPEVFYAGKGIPSKYYIYTKFIENNNTAKKYFAKTDIIHIENKKIVGKNTKLNTKKQIVLKPDKGARSAGVFITDNKNQRENILLKAKTNYIYQEYIPHNLELGVFYIKDPKTGVGKIIGISEKVISNRISNSIKSGERIKSSKQNLKSKNIINHDDGLGYISRNDLITKNTTKIFNEIIKNKKIYFCRFDVRTKNSKEFCSGKFKILEVNMGFTAVMLHAFDNKLSIKKQIMKYNGDFKIAFKISEQLKNMPKLSILTFLYNFISDEFNLVLLKVRLRSVN